MQKDTEFKHSYVFLNTQFTAQFASTSALHVEVGWDFANYCVDSLNYMLHVPKCLAFVD